MLLILCNDFHFLLKSVPRGTEILKQSKGQTGKIMSDDSKQNMPPFLQSLTDSVLTQTTGDIRFLKICIEAELERRELASKKNGEKTK